MLEVREEAYSNKSCAPWGLGLYLLLTVVNEGVAYLLFGKGIGKQSLCLFSLTWSGFLTFLVLLQLL